MSVKPQQDGPPASDMLVEVYDPAAFAARPPPDRDRRAALRSSPAAMDPKVLVVADEILLRIVVSEALSFAGVGVIEAADAAEAADVLAERHDVGLLLTDVSVPGRVDDVGLAWRFSVEYPDLALVMMSALLEPSSMEIPPGAVFIRKPFLPDLLVKVVKPLLAARSSVLQEPGHTSSCAHNS